MDMTQLMTQFWATRGKHHPKKKQKKRRAPRHWPDFRNGIRFWDYVGYGPIPLPDHVEARITAGSLEDPPFKVDTTLDDEFLEIVS